MAAIRSSGINLEVIRSGAVRLTPYSTKIKSINLGERENLYDKMLKILKIHKNEGAHKQDHM